MSDDEEMGSPPDLGQAGAGVEKMIRAMIEEQEIDPLVVASALLAGSIGLLVDGIGAEATMQVLHNAIASVEEGEFGDDEEEDEDGEEEEGAPKKSN